MKKIFSLLLISSLLMMGTISAEAASLWSKYVTDDGSFSFHYPKGWEVGSNESIVAVKNSKSDEQLVMAMLNFDQLKSPQDLANGFLSILKDGNPNIKASYWQNQLGLEEEQVIFDLTDKRNGKKYSGLGIVIKSDQQAIWFSYFAPEADYYQIRSANILQGFMGSLAEGSNSKTPNVNYNVDVAKRINKNAKAFLFTLEFALGMPFTKVQEDKILVEIKDAWRYLSEEELQVYDQYPALVNTVLQINEEELEVLRGDLEKSISEWLDETDQSDSVVKIIKSQLETGGSIVIDGESALTERALNAYSEIIAYSRLLQKNSKAKPDQISKETVNNVKKQVKEEWKSLSANDKKSIATCSGLWFCLRAQFQYGSKKDQDKIRTELKKLTIVPAKKETNQSTNAITDKNKKSGNKKPMDMITHTAMLQIQQNMFNHYRWLRGFTY